MTLRQFLVQRYITNPDEQTTYAAVNGAITTDWDQAISAGDVVEVDWRNVGIKQWRVEQCEST